MTKEEIKQLEIQIKSFIKTLDQYNNEELVYYYKETLTLRANWDIEISWSIKELKQ